MLHNQPNNVPKPAVHVPKNVKSIHTWSLVKNAQKNAESVKQNVKSVRQNAKLFSHLFYDKQLLRWYGASNGN